MENAIMPNKDGGEMSDRYKRAQVLESAVFSETLVRNASIFPNWIAGADCFWYLRRTRNGVEYRIVDAIAQTNELAFSHKDLAQSLSGHLGKDVSPGDLRLDDLMFKGPGGPITFNVDGEKFLYRPDLVELETVGTESGQLVGISEREVCSFPPQFEHLAS